MRICLGMLLLAFACAHDFYIFSYRAAMRNGMLINEAYNVARSMSVPKVFDVRATCEIGEPLGDLTVFYRLRTEKDAMLLCFMRNGIGLRDDTTVLNLASRSTTTLWIAPVVLRAREIDGYAVVEILDIKE